MTFLILKIFAYLVLAALIGAAAGWLFRNLEAQKSEEKANRAAHDAKSKVPQLESLLRGRDEQISKFKGQVDEAKALLTEREQTLRQVEQQLRDSEREAKRWQQSAEAKGPNQNLDNLDFEQDFDAADVAEAEGNADELISELSREIAELKAAQATALDDLARAQSELSTAQAERARAQEDLLAAQDTASSAEGNAPLGGAEAQLRDQVQTLRNQLDRETAKVVELERERELQNKSLKVLHQQLELERHKAAG